MTFGPHEDDELPSDGSRSILWRLILGSTLVAFLLLGWGIHAAFAAPTCNDLAANPYYAPPACGSGPVCWWSGPGGCTWTWTLAAELAVLKGQTLAVPQALCASACVIALGKAIEIGGKVEITPGAQLIWPHGRRSFAGLGLPPQLARRVVMQ